MSGKIKNNYRICPYCLVPNKRWRKKCINCGWDFSKKVRYKKPEKAKVST